MDEKNKTQHNITPVARVKPADAATHNADPQTNPFASAYLRQKQDAPRSEGERQNAAAQPNAAPEQPPVVSPQPEENKKFNIIFIVLITIIIVLFGATLAYLLSQRSGTRQGAVEDETQSEPTLMSASLSSPFSIQTSPAAQLPAGMQEKYAQLYAQNQDFAGWLTVPGTSIDMPVYQQSNNSYYLKHDNYGTYTKYGAAFMDMYSSRENLTRNTVIYAHNFDNGLIFDELHNYAELDFYKQNPVITFNTPYADYKWKVIAAFHTNGTSAGDNGYLFYYVAAYMSDDNFMDFTEHLSQRSYIHTGVDIQPTDKILTLSTCTYFFDRGGSIENARFAVVARLVREGESEYVDVSQATKNENVRYPQLYYDVFGGENPYADAEKWYSE